MDEGDDREERGGGISDAQFMQEINARDAEVTTLLRKKDKIRALLVSLQNPPIACKSVAVKDANSAIVEKAVAAFTDAELTSAVEALDMESCDILMKYLYRFMAHVVNCGTALKMHALLTEKAGVGSIVRVLTDRKSV